MSIAFETERLSARRPVMSDAPDITRMMQEKDIPLMLGRAPWPYALADAEGWIDGLHAGARDGTEYGFLLLHKDHGLIGSTGMTHVSDDIWEIGYWIGKPFWGQGFVTEGARGLMDWASVKHNVTRYVSGHIFDNPASGHVLTKLGFTPVGEVTMYTRGRNCDVRAVRYVRGAPAEIALAAAAHFKRPET